MSSTTCAIVAEGLRKRYGERVVLDGLDLTVPGRLRWAVTDGRTITRRALLHWARQPAQVIVGLLFPSVRHYQHLHR